MGNPESKPMKMYYKTINGRQEPVYYPQYWSEEIDDWVISSDVSPLPVSDAEVEDRLNTIENRLDSIIEEDAVVSTMMGKDPDGNARGVEVSEEGAVKTEVTGSKVTLGANVINDVALESRGVQQDFEIGGTRIDPDETRTVIDVTGYGIVDNIVFSTRDSNKGDILFDIEIDNNTFFPKLGEFDIDRRLNLAENITKILKEDQKIGYLKLVRKENPIWCWENIGVFGESLKVTFTNISEDTARGISYVYYKMGASKVVNLFLETEKESKEIHRNILTEFNLKKTDVSVVIKPKKDEEKEIVLFLRNKAEVFESEIKDYIKSITN